MIYRYLPGSSALHRTDPLSKFIWLGCVSVLCIGSSDYRLQAALLGAVALLGVFGAGLKPALIRRGLRPVLLFAAPYFFLQLLLAPGETELWRIGRFALTAEALAFGAAVALRIFTLALASFVFIVTTDPRDFVLALAQQVRIPYRFAMGVGIALRFLPILAQEAAQIRAAQRLRGRGRSADWRAGLLRERRFALAVLIAAVRKVETLAAAMELKGFGLHPHRTYRRAVRMTREGKMLTALSLAAAAAWALARIFLA
jgi:energy-coupling factor transport system permease protein